MNSKHGDDHNASAYSLPWPPSVNGYWRSIVRGGRPCQILSERGRIFRVEADASIKFQGVRRYDTPVRVSVSLHPPTRRKYDIDNYAKAALDALMHAGVLADDELVCDLHMRKGDIVKGGRVDIRIEPEAA